MSDQKLEEQSSQHGQSQRDVVSKQVNKRTIVDVAITGDSRVHEKEFRKIEKCQDLKKETKLLWAKKNVDVVLLF